MPRHARGLPPRHSAAEASPDHSPKIGQRRGEAVALNNLGVFYTELGQTHPAIEMYEEALTLTREIGRRRGGAIAQTNLGNRYAELGQWPAAAVNYRPAIEIAETMGSAEGQAIAHDNLAQAQLWAGDLPAARQAIDTARTHTYPPAQAEIALLDGLIHLRQHFVTAAEQAFRDAITDGASSPEARVYQGR